MAKTNSFPNNITTVQPLKINLIEGNDFAHIRNITCLIFIKSDDENINNNVILSSFNSSNILNLKINKNRFINIQDGYIIGTNLTKQKLGNNYEIDATYNYWDGNNNSHFIENTYIYNSQDLSIVKVAFMPLYAEDENSTQFKNNKTVNNLGLFSEIILTSVIPLVLESKSDQKNESIQIINEQISFTSSNSTFWLDSTQVLSDKSTKENGNLLTTTEIVNVKNSNQQEIQRILSKIKILHVLIAGVVLASLVLVILALVFYCKTSSSTQFQSSQSSGQLAAPSRPQIYSKVATNPPVD